MGLLRKYGPWALVTGASAGIGLEFARRLAGTGFNLLLVARRSDRLEAIARALSERHRVIVETLVADLVVPDARAALIARATELRVGLVIANAGFGKAGRSWEVPREHVVDMVRLNCEAVADIVHGVLQYMTRQRRGGIIITSSVLGHIPGPFYSVYSATKAFDLSLAESLWGELHGTGIDVLALCPGRTRSEFSAIAGSNQNESAADSPATVVKQGLRALGRQPAVVTGRRSNVLTVLASRLVPRGWVSRAVARIMGPSILRKSYAELKRLP